MSAPDVRHCHDIRNGKTQAEMRAEILRLEAAMFAMPEHHIEFPVKHHFGPQTYMREMFIPKGATVTGKIHRHEHLNILSQGHLSVMTENGVKELRASTVIKSMPGIKRAAYAHEDSVWITVHHNPDNETDPDNLEARIVFESFGIDGDAKLMDYMTSGRTYHDAIGVHGFTHEQALAVSLNQADQIQFPDGVTGVSVRHSPIHGMGLFSEKYFSRGEVIAPARIGGKRTPGGSRCNHSSDPNSEMVMREGGDVDLVALKDIQSGAEILNDYFFNYLATRPITKQIQGGKKS